MQNFTGYGLPIFLSEYGCIQNVRDFGEIGALMSNKMTSVYSGGLMYEYTYEENKFGIVKIDDKAQKGERKELPEFAAFAKAMKAFPAPTGSGGASTTTNSVPCPTKDQYWDVDSTLLPAFPEDAKVYLKNGAGKGPGLDGPGSQNSGPADPKDAEPGSGAVDGAGGKKNAAVKGRMDNAPLLVSGAVLMMTVLGAIAL